MDQKTCGESNSHGCAQLTFINDSPTRRSYTLREMRETFLSFFEKHGHKRIQPYPVVARWREDLYLTNASIIDFQPYVTNGIIPPPANPLVISQPCIRLKDVDDVGPTFGRHLTVFEMGGHHAFNYEDKEVYWKDQTVRYHHQFITGELGVKSEEVIYKEDVWSGGGNAGPDLETIVRGLELDTLVFMKFKVVDSKFIELPIRTVDTGYGIERYAWLSQGSVSCFDTVYSPILDKIFRMVGISQIEDKLLVRVAELSGVMELGETANRMETRRKVAEQVGMKAEELTKLFSPLENVFAVVDHTKCLALMLAEGVVPSNVGEGYLARLMIRRTHRLLRLLGIEEKILDIVDMQLNFWSSDFPRLEEMREQVLEILSVEQDKFKETLKRGRSLVKRILETSKDKSASQILNERLIELYDSHGLPPEVVQETAEEEGVKVVVPENFYRMVAEQHLQTPTKREAEAVKKLEAKITDLPDTKRLYYENSDLSKFEAEVLRVLDGDMVVLEKTAFYPEGGGQPADKGYFIFDGDRSEVVDVQKAGKVVVHKLSGKAPKAGDKVEGVVDWERRSILMKQHTATHILMGAARRVLGEHVWQAGAQKGVEHSRLDISHFRRLTLEEIQRIETLANEAVTRNIPVETSWMPRGEAEERYGFRLYQGGAVPGKEIRVVKIGDWNVEACAGTHVSNTAQIGLIKVIHTERVQDGVERLVFSVGLPALESLQESDRLLWKLSEVLNAPREKIVRTAKRLVKGWKENRKEKERLIKEVANLKASTRQEVEVVKPIEGVKFSEREVESANVDLMIQTANEVVKRDLTRVAVFYGVKDEAVNFVVMAGKDAVNRGVNAGKIAQGMASVVGGGGGGRPDFAQGGGTEPDKMSKALQRAEETIEKQVKKTGSVKSSVDE
jgi:alanyl-tRNA synthetase